jgi:hypothetical protein
MAVFTAATIFTQQWTFAYTMIFRLLGGTSQYFEICMYAKRRTTTAVRKLYINIAPPPAPPQLHNTFLAHRFLNLFVGVCKGDAFQFFVLFSMKIF